MYTFLLRPKWIAFHVLVIAAIVTMLSLASWQWSKYGARNDFVEKVEARLEAEPQELTSLLASSDDPADVEYFRATARGRYVPEDELVQINRTQSGASGVNVLTPFEIDGDAAGSPFVVIVNRGFVADGVEPEPAPAGLLVVGGTVRASQVRRTGELTDTGSGNTGEVRRVDLPEIEALLGYDIAPVYLDLIATDPASPEPPTPVPPPDLSGGPPHLSYAIQWCIFSAAVAVGWVLAVRRSARSRHRAQPSA